MDDANPEAEAFAIGQGKILSVGSTKKIRDSFPDTEVIDLKGQTVMPGIIESHGHLLSLGQSFLELNVEGVETPAAVIARVAERVKETPPGQWIIGWGWDEGAWARNYPANDELSRVSPENPVYLRGLHGFACWVNERALDVAGITAETPDPPNGAILKDTESGKPIGILTNEAQELVTRHIPPLSQQQIEKALQMAIEECLKHGLTTVHEARTTSVMLEAFQSLLRVLFPERSGS